MVRIAIVLMMVLVLLAGCIGLQPVELSSDTTTYFKILHFNYFSEEEKRKIENSIRVHLSMWEYDNKQKSSTFTVRVYRKPIISKNADGKRVIYLGYANSKKKEIAIWVGDHFEAPAMYHELCHLNIDHDGHTNPNWRYWDARGDQISSELEKFYSSQKRMLKTLKASPKKIFIKSLSAG